MDRRTIPLALALAIAAETGEVNLEGLGGHLALKPGILAELFNEWRSKNDPLTAAKEPANIQAQWYNFPNFPNFPNFLNCYSGYWRNC